MEVAEVVAGGAVCAQCGRPVPLNGTVGELDELTAAMLLCPDCRDEDRSGDYDGGEAD